MKKEGAKNAARKLIIIKTGTSSLTLKSGDMAPEKINALVCQIAALKREGHDVVLVSSGAIAAGFRRLGYAERPRAIAARQAAAAVGQGLLMEEYSKKLFEYGYICAQVLLNRSDFCDHKRYRNVYQALSLLLKKGAVPVINENDTVAVDELCFGDNDALAAQVAGMLHGDLLIIVTDTEGLFTADPKKNPAALPIKEADAADPRIAAIAGDTAGKTGTGGMRSKIAAARIAALAGVPMLICGAAESDTIVNAVHGKAAGTYFASRGSALSNNLQWLAFCSLAKGTLYVDAGAVSALETEGRSLLPSGIKRFYGNFDAGDVVEVKSLEKRYIGKGISAYDAEELRTIIANSAKGERKKAVIHRNNWIGAVKTTGGLL
jgi:glutamate 5-kinase